MTVRSAVCVTGEARAFRHAAVRASLLEFLMSVQTVALDMAIARYTSACSRSLISISGIDAAERCAAAMREGLVMNEAALRAEFAGGPWSKHMRLELYETSSCANGRHVNATCCHGPPHDSKGASSSSWRPIAYLQYSELSRCAIRLAAAAALLPRHERATHVIRTRPDLFYLELAGSSFSTWLERLASIKWPTMVRKAQEGSPFATTLVPTHPPGAKASLHVMFAKNAVEAHQPGDWFMVVPLIDVDGFFTELTAPLESACARGIWSGVRSPSTPTPEAWLLATRTQCNQTSGKCAGPPRWFSPYGLPQHNVHFRGVECESRPPSLGERCLADFAVTMLSVGTTAACARLNNSALCEQRVLAVLDADANG